MQNPVDAFQSLYFWATILLAPMTLRLLILLLPPWLYLFFLLQPVPLEFVYPGFCPQLKVLNLPSFSTQTQSVWLVSIPLRKFRTCHFSAWPLQQPPDWSSCIHPYAIKATFYPAARHQLKVDFTGHQTHLKGLLRYRLPGTTLGVFT